MGADHAAEPAGPVAATRRPTRTKARKRAVDILFESELRGTDLLTTLAERTADADPPVREFTDQLVRGVADNRTVLDERISSHLAAGWTLSRLPRVDRAVLRVAAYELERGEVPADVAVAEAVGLARELSTDDSPAFVNGVLAALATEAGATHS